MASTIIVSIIAICFIVTMSVVAVVPVILEWLEERAVKRASERYVKRHGGRDGQ